MLTDLFLVRHGDPLTDTGLPYRSMPGPDLSEHGRNEAQQAALFLADKGIEHLFVSPFARAAQTADYIVDHLPVTVTFTSLVAEHETSEDLAQVQHRITEFLASLKQAPFQRIAVISHGTPIRYILMTLTDERVDLRKHVYGNGNPAPTAGIWHVWLQTQGWQADLIFQPS